MTLANFPNGCHFFDQCCRCLRPDASDIDPHHDGWHTLLRVCGASLTTHPGMRLMTMMWSTPLSLLGRTLNGDALLSIGGASNGVGTLLVPLPMMGLC